MKIFSAVKIFKDGYCGLCHTDAAAVAEITIQEPRRGTVVFICRRCLETVGGLFDKPQKELYQGEICAAE
jgi:hypothetical protein